MLLALNRIVSPVLGWRQARAASSSIRGASSPASAGALKSGPMMTKRSRAQRTRAGVIVSWLMSPPLARDHDTVIVSLRALATLRDDAIAGYQHPLRDITPRPSAQRPPSQNAILRPRNRLSPAPSNVRTEAMTSRPHPHRYCPLGDLPGHQDAQATTQEAWPRQAVAARSAPAIPSMSAASETHRATSCPTFAVFARAPRLPPGPRAPWPRP